MNFARTEEQELLLESLDEFLNGCGFDDSYFRECYEKSETPAAFYKAVYDAGFGTLGLPEKYGGTEVDLVTLVMVAERMESRGFPNTFGAVLQIDDMVTFGSEEQRKIVFDYLTKTGRSCFSLGITEPQAGSDNSAMATTATYKDGKVIINGHKSFITNAKENPYMLLLCREADMEGNPISMYLVPSDSEGITFSPLHKIGWKLGSMYEVRLENVEVPESALVGTRGKGFIQLMKNFEIERLVLAAGTMGQAICAFEDATKYAVQREQFGQKIGDFQLVQQKITEMYIKIENMRNLVYSTAWKKDQGMSVRLECGTTKYYCARTAFEVCDDAMQVMGGIGYTEECRISRFWRNARMHRIGGGTDEIMIRTSAKEILKKYR